MASSVNFFFYNRVYLSFDNNLDMSIEKIVVECTMDFETLKSNLEFQKL